MNRWHITCWQYIKNWKNKAAKHGSHGKGRLAGKDTGDVGIGADMPEPFPITGNESANLCFVPPSGTGVFDAQQIYKIAVSPKTAEVLARCGHIYLAIKFHTVDIHKAELRLAIGGNIKKDVARRIVFVENTFSVQIGRKFRKLADNGLVSQY